MTGPAVDKNPVHWVVQMNHRNRTVFSVVYMIAMAWHVAGAGRGHALLYGLMAASQLVYPQLGFQLARRAREQLAAELNFLRLDAVLLGGWCVALGFPLWISFLFAITVGINLIAFRGVQGLLQAAGVLLLGAAATVGVLALAGSLPGWRFLPDTSLGVTLLCMASLSAYLARFAQGSHSRTLALSEAKLKLRQSGQALQHQLQEIHVLQAQLTETANRDALTGLYNRRYLDATLARELARCGRERAPLSLLLIDIDHFKRINDSLGHQAGDEVLRAVGELLGGEVRAGDVACRYGGEEFLILLPAVSQAIALERAESCRRLLAERTIEVGGSRLQITLSVGVAGFPLQAATPEALIEAADQALYRAKAGGRNRVVGAAGPATTGAAPALAEA